MKRALVGISAATFSLVAGLFLSCSLLGPSSGSLTIPFPESVLSASAERAILSTGETVGYVRIYLQSQGGFVPVDGTGTVYERAIPANRSITIDGIPPLRDCTLLLALSRGSGSAFRAARYATSNSFNVVAGSTATVSLTALDSPFADLFVGFDAAGVRALTTNGHSYYLAGGTVYADGSSRSLAVAGTNGIGKAQRLAAGRVMESTGAFGSDLPWICTDKGLWILADDGTTMSISQLATPNDLGEISGAGAISLQYDDNGQTTYQDVMYYQGPYGRFGGAYGQDGSWSWFDLRDYLDQLPSTLRDSIEESTSSIVQDYSIDSSSTFGYAVVPSINNFRVGGDIVKKIEDLGSDPGFQSLLDAVLKGNTITVAPISGLTPLVSNVSVAGGKLYIGSNLGISTLAVSADGSLPTDASGNSLPAQALSLGKTITVAKLKATTIGSIVYAAALSKSGNLYLLKNGVLAATYPFYSGLPDFDGDARKTGSLYWRSDGLVVGGTNGVVLLSAAKLP